jgi:hypothetical protein
VGLQLERCAFRHGPACATLPDMPALLLKSLLFVLASVLWVVLPQAVLAQTAVDLELVLAVDVSLSMDMDEQRLQRDGYVQALRDPEVQKAIASGPNGRIAVTYMEWAGPPSQTVVVPWTIIDSPAAARAFADQLEAAPISRARMTSISAALTFSKALLASSGVRGIRRVVDVSGDGPNNAGFPVSGIRDELINDGIVINGLPIVLKRSNSWSMFDLEHLDRYYTDCVIGGTGAFMIPIREPGEFKTATRRKLLLEISGLEMPARVIRTQVTETTDCSVGERQWRRYLDGTPN